MDKKIGWDKLLAVVLVLYALTLAVLAADRLLGLGIYRPKLDRMILRDIDMLADPANRDRAAEEIISHHEFSIPILIETLEKQDLALKEPVTRCLEAIASKYFDADNSSFGPNPQAWRRWWEATRTRLESRQSPA